MFDFYTTWKRQNIKGLNKLNCINNIFLKELLCW